MRNSILLYYWTKFNVLYCDVVSYVDLSLISLPLMLEKVYESETEWDEMNYQVFVLGCDFPIQNKLKISRKHILKCKPVKQHLSSNCQSDHVNDFTKYILADENDKFLVKLDTVRNVTYDFMLYKLYLDKKNDISMNYPITNKSSEPLKAKSSSEFITQNTPLESDLSHLIITSNELMNPDFNLDKSPVINSIEIKSPLLVNGNDNNKISTVNDNHIKVDNNLNVHKNNQLKKPQSVGILKFKFFSKIFHYVEIPEWVYEMQFTELLLEAIKVNSKQLQCDDSDLKDCSTSIYITKLYMDEIVVQDIRFWVKFGGYYQDCHLDSS